MLMLPGMGAALEAECKARPSAHLHIRRRAGGMFRRTTYERLTAAWATTRVEAIRRLASALTAKEAVGRASSSEWWLDCF